jgi:hypothetical protein
MEGFNWFRSQPAAQVLLRLRRRRLRKTQLRQVLGFQAQVVQEGKQIVLNSEFHLRRESRPSEQEPGQKSFRTSLSDRFDRGVQSRFILLRAGISRFVFLVMFPFPGGKVVTLRLLVS